MKLHGGFYLPDHETHLCEWVDANNQIVDNRKCYQWHKLKAALERVTNFETAVDCGGHVGYFSYHLVKRFNYVAAFEPMAEHRECFKKNMPDDNYTLHPFALGAKEGRVSLTVPKGSSGGTFVSGNGEIEMRTLDSFSLEDVGFLKCDVEGFELQVVMGGVDTIRTYKPVILIEQKNHTPGGMKHIAPGSSKTPAVDFLLGMGYEIKQVISGDYILSCD